jgi:two-component system invasion response regulator UvrY
MQGARHVRVLVVDDHAGIRAAVSAVVEATAGFELAGAAGSGEEALAWLDDQPADLVLMDVAMPGCGGVQAAKTIAQMATQPAVFLMSSIEQPQIAADPCAHGAAAFIAKEDLSPEFLRHVWSDRFRAAA